MSGGHFDYKEHYLNDISNTIQWYIDNNGTEKSKEDLFPWDYDSITKEIKEDCKYYHKYSQETLNIFKEAIKIIKLAYIYMHRIDYLLEGDDGEEDFHERLKKELEEIKE